MEQRIYRGDVSPSGMADYLAQQYNMQDRFVVQKLGEGDSMVVQIGYRQLYSCKSRDQSPRNPVTVGICRAPGGEDALVVTMGERKWLTPELVGYTAMAALFGLLIPMVAIFYLIWPVSLALGSRTLPKEIWRQIELYAMSQGWIPGPGQTLAILPADGPPTRRLSEPRFG